MIRGETIVFDFDKTLTTTDTIKFLVLCLLPHRILALPSIVKHFIRYKHGKESAETMKHSIIGALIKGRSDESMTINLRLFKMLVCLIKRKNIYAIMMRHLHRKDTVIIATASPHFAVSFLFKDFDLYVLGSNYYKNNDLYTGQVCRPIPFGKQKAILLQAFLSEINANSINTAYSDSKSDLPLLNMACESYFIDPKGYIIEAVV